MASIKQLTKAAAARFGIQLASTHHFGIDPLNDIGRLTSITAFQTVLDVGAHEGETSLHYAAAIPSAKVFAFEPVRANYAKLRKNVRGVSRITCVNQAVGSVAGSALIRYGGSSQTHSLSHALKRSSSDTLHSETIQVTTLDSFCALAHIDHVDLLKTDTEGFDLEVLKGAKGLLQNKQIDFVYSEASFVDDGLHTSFQDVFTFLTNYGMGFVGLYDVSITRSPSRIEFCNVLFSRC